MTTTGNATPGLLPEIDLMARLAAVEKFGPKRGHEVALIVAEIVDVLATQMARGDLTAGEAMRASQWIVERTRKAHTDAVAEYAKRNPGAAPEPPDADDPPIGTSTE